MTIKTKYNLGDFVYTVSIKKSRIKIPNNCPVCKDEGQVKLNEKSYTCPECRGYTYTTKEGKDEWYVNDCEGHIGKIDVEMYHSIYVNGDQRQASKIKYMLDTTGVGTGTVWREKNLFPSKEEAETECIKRNDK